VTIANLFMRKSKKASDLDSARDFGEPSSAAGGKTSNDDFFQEIKHRIHRQLVEEINLVALEKLEAAEVRPEVWEIVERMLKEGKVILNEAERNALVDEIIHELKGLGPIEPLLKDPTVSDILCNTYEDIYVERYGLLERVDTRFRDNSHLMNIIDRIVSKVGRRVDESSPMVDARLADGSRVNVIIPPLAIDGPILSIRRFAVIPLQMDDLIRFKTITPQIGQFLHGCVKTRLNILVSGGTGSGKTTLLNILSRFIPEKERIVTIEDSAELQLQQEHVVRLETRPPSLEGTGQITQRDLVRNSLRMRPDRIIVGEVRGPEAFDMLQAMNTGHEGSLSTIHANSPRDSLTRLESMILMSGFRLPENAMRFMISSALDLIIQVARLSDGTRKVLSVKEITGMEGDMITMQDIFVYERKGIDANGKELGHFRATGVRPKFADKIALAGFKLPEDIFCSDRIYE
jgi:pilus assembly protein CpaF